MTTISYINFVAGIFVCTDRDRNVILGLCNEYLKEPCGEWLFSCHQKVISQIHDYEALYNWLKISAGFMSIITILLVPTIY